MDPILNKRKKHPVYHLSPTQKQQKKDNAKIKKATMKMKILQVKELEIKLNEMEKVIQQQQLEKNQMQHQISHLESVNLELRKQLEEQKIATETAERIVTNTSILIFKLPHNSPFRRPLLSFF